MYAWIYTSSYVYYKMTSHGFVHIAMNFIAKECFPFIGI